MEDKRQALLSGRWAVLLAAVLAMGAVAATGCGGGGDEASNSAGGSGASGPKVVASAMSDAQFLKRANAICVKLRGASLSQLTTFAAKYQKEGRPEGVLLREMMRKVVVPRIKRETAELAKLGAPADRMAQLQEFVDLQTQGTEKALAMGSPKSLEAIAKNFDAAGTKARALGIANCDNGAASSSKGS